MKNSSRAVLALLLSAATTTLIFLGLPAARHGMIDAGTAVIKFFTEGKLPVNSLVGIGIAIWGMFLSLAVLALFLACAFYLLLPKFLPSLKIAEHEMDRRRWNAPEKLRRVVFGYDILCRFLTVFASEADAIAAVEGLTIAEGDYKFFAGDGSPLEAEFSVPAEIYTGSNTYSNGVYTLKPCNTGENLFHLLRIVECKDKAKSGLLTLRDVEQLLIDYRVQGIGVTCNPKIPPPR